MNKLLRSYAIIAVGCLFFSISFDWFFSVNQIAMGGVTGLAQVIHAVFPPLSVGLLTILINVPLFLLGWKYIGFHLLASSLFSMLVSSAAIDFIAAIHTFQPMDPMLASLCGGALLGLGVGIVFTQGATTGGTDIVARLLKLKFPWLPMGKLVLVPDFVVLTLAALVFGRVEAALYGLVGLFVSSQVIDAVLYGLNTAKVAYIVSDRSANMRETILRLDRGGTILEARGAYTGEAKQVVMVAFRQKEIVQIKKAIHETDPHAFFIVCNAHEIMGEGFGEYKSQEV